MAAQAGSNLCPADKVCVYVNDDFGGLMGYRAPGGGIKNVSTTNNDEMSSWENKTGNARWFHGLNGNGNCVTMARRSEDNNINFIDNDEMSSWATNGGCP